MIVLFHIPYSCNLRLDFPDCAAKHELIETAKALGAFCYTVEDPPCVPSGSWVPPEWLGSTSG